MELNLQQIFTDTGSNGLKESFREFLGYFVKQFFPGVNTQIEKLYFARFDYPLFVFPIFIIAITGLIFFWEKPTKLRAILAALPAGLLFYFYFHYWVYWVTVISILFFYTLVFQYQNKSRLKNFLWLATLLSLIAAPYFINYFNFSKTNTTLDYAHRLGIAEGREPGLAELGFDYILYIFLALIAYKTFWDKNRHKTILIWSFLIAAVLIWNIQLFTGFVPAPNNFRRTISPLLFVIIGMISYELSTRLTIKIPQTKKILSAILIVLTLLVVSKKIVNVFVIKNNPENRILENYVFSKNIKESWDWINSDLKSEPKIMSNSFMTSLYLGAYTSARPFLPLGNLTTKETSELEKRFLLANKIFGVSSDTVKKQLSGTLYIDCSKELCPPNTDQNLRKNLWHLYFHYFRIGSINKYLADPEHITKEYIDNLVKDYDKMPVDVEKIDSDFIYYGSWEKQFSKNSFNNKNEFELVYQNPEIKIYKILKNN
ncbi:MAG: hypothetical protein Q8Q90_02225 [bacterium]|nr:hypothetical protein [bacterium]